MKITPVILSGGSGTRLWPMSRAALPKQLLPLVSERSMLQDTLTRLEGWPEIQAPLIVCGNDHRFLVAEQLREIGIEPAAILLEPVGRNTAPAIAVAAHRLRETGQDALMLVLAADHVILDIDAFHQAVITAAGAAIAGRLVTFGIYPSGPETGYGYIRRGDALPDNAGSFAVQRFVEKPDLQTAEGYLADGSYYWNSGMFLFRPEVYLGELERLRPEIATGAARALAGSYRDLDFCRLEEQAFAACPSDSIDYAVMEHTGLAAVVPAAMGWSDVGSWNALWEVQAHDESGNSLRGDIYVDDVQNSLIRAESRIVAAIGIRDVVVVETSDAVLVAHKDSAQDVRKVVEYLKRNARREHEYHTRVYRPWGWYEGIDAGPRFQVKRIMVKPGAKLSLQMHHHRAEHWVVVKGTALVTRGDETFMLSENESTYIPIGVTHRLENPGRLPLEIIEVQSGSYLGEDDIVRFDDIYQRS
jgi:mannose-1-phosphate guanylyltransferase/mannose-6-phosphate isomerase